ncbi:MAG TPA: sulfatase [Pirellulales bacterium]|nr:sulfatase [Pirellulales bacterium]
MLRGVLIGLLSLACLPAPAAHPIGKFNVLFVVVDDLRPDLGCYGNSLVVSPKIDALAHDGIVFNRAYCQQALCSPSRASVLTGLRPDTTKIFDNKTPIRSRISNHATLPQYFKEHGYRTLSLGKVYHDFQDDPQSWSAPPWHPEHQEYARPEKLSLNGKAGEAAAKGPAWEDAEVPDNTFRDGKTADRAVDILSALKDERFFLAVGFRKPHLPFVAPKKYYDLYAHDRLRLANNPFAPRGVPSIAMEDSIELRLFYRGIPEKPIPVPDETARDLIHGYYACISYVDSQIGRVLAEINRLGLREHTVIVLWGDHGWHLGEHGVWGKSHNFETTTRAPLIVSVPGQTKCGVATDALVELVDLYPTLAELCGLPVPGGLDGISMVPVIDAPDRPWKKAAFSQYARHAGKIMGYSLRTDRYRYTEWAKVDDHSTLGVELYDHEVDPDENVTLAGDPGRSELVTGLSRQLRAGWREALPMAGAP